MSYRDDGGASCCGCVVVLVLALVLVLLFTGHLVLPFFVR
jgi:hypothetical protein